MFPLQVSSQFVSIPLSQNMCSSKEAGLKRDDFLFLKAMNICKWSKRENFCPKFPNYFPSNIPNQLHEVTSTTNKTTRFNIFQKITRLPEQLFFKITMIQSSAWILMHLQQDFLICFPERYIHRTLMRSNQLP